MTLGHHQHIHALQHDGVTVVELMHEELIDEEIIRQWGDELFGVAESPDCDRLVISFARARLLASAALGKLVTLQRRIQQKGGRLVFCELPDTVGDVLRACRLDTIFTICTSRDEALAALS
jgi:anti-sigma B factor antagonist